MIKNKAQSLFEVIAILGIVSLVLTALLWTSTLSVRNASSSDTKAQATRLAQEALEWIRSERDRSWQDFFIVNVVPNPNKFLCLSDLSWNWNQGCINVNGTQFQRRAFFTCYQDDDPNGGEMPCGVANNLVRVRVEVSWNESSGPENVVVSTILTSWNR